MLFILDNYDSFTYNLVQRFGEIDARLDVRVARNDQVTIDEIAAMQPSGIVVSPGPCTPHEAGISMELIRQLGPRIPTLGVCLGHQSMAEVFNSPVVRAERLMHGKVSPPIHHRGNRRLCRVVESRFHGDCAPAACTSPKRLSARNWKSRHGPTFPAIRAKSWACVIERTRFTAFNSTRKAF